MSTDSDRASRPPRTDSARNRTLLLDAAGEVVAERGSTAALDEIARRARVSSGTLYRHFGDRSMLMRALYDRIADRTDELVDRALREPSGWAALECYVDGIIELTWQFPETSAVFAFQREHDPGYRPGDQWVQPMLDTRERALAEGSIRADVSATDLAYLPHLLGQLVSWPEPARGMLLARMRGILLDGIRPDSASHEPLPREPLSIEQVRSLSHHERPPKL